MKACLSNTAAICCYQFAARCCEGEILVILALFFFFKCWGVNELVSKMPQLAAAKQAAEAAAESLAHLRPSKNVPEIVIPSV